MIISLLGIILGFYTFSRKVIKEEITTSRIESFLNFYNNKLSTFSKNDSEINIKSFLTFSIRIILLSILIILISKLLLPARFSKEIIQLFAPILIISFLISFSIKWILNHKKSISSYYFNIPNIILMFIPTIYYFFGEKFNSLIDIDIFINPFMHFYNNLGVLKFQISWIISFVILTYITLSFIAVPIYYFLYIIIFFSAYIIKNIEKYIDRNIIDAIFGILTFIIIILKIFY